MKKNKIKNTREIIDWSSLKIQTKDYWLPDGDGGKFGNNQPSDRNLKANFGDTTVGRDVSYWPFDPPDRFYEL